MNNYLHKFMIELMLEDGEESVAVVNLGAMSSSSAIKFNKAKTKNKAFKNIWRYILKETVKVAESICFCRVGIGIRGINIKMMT